MNNEIEEIITRNIAVFRMMSAYSGHSIDDIRSIVTYCYYLNELDKKDLEPEEIDSIIKKAYRKETVKDNYFGKRIENNQDLNRTKSNFISETLDKMDCCFESDILMAEAYAKLKSLANKDELNYCIEYLDNGQKYMAYKYSITEMASRKRFQRYCNNMKKLLT